jgi:hypothetical protein
VAQNRDALETVSKPDELQRLYQRTNCTSPRDVVAGTAVNESESLLVKESNATIAPDPARQEAYARFLVAMVQYLVTAAETITERDLREAFTATIPGGDVIVSTIAQQWIAQGFQKGLQQGLQQALLQGIQQGQQQGLRQGLFDGITLGLELRWGSAGLYLLPEIGRIEDVHVLRAIHEGLKRVSTPEELRQIYRQTN